MNKKNDKEQKVILKHENESDSNHSSMRKSTESSVEPKVDLQLHKINLDNFNFFHGHHEIGFS